MRMKVEKRIVVSWMPQEVIFRNIPRMERIAIEKPKLNPIRSVFIILVGSVLVGKRMKTSRYPGMKRRKGSPKIIRNISDVVR